MTVSHQPDHTRAALSSGAGLTDRLRRLFLEHLSIDVPSAETDLIVTGSLDSLALVELLLQLEREFQLTIPLDEFDINQFRTLRGIEEFILAATRPTAKASQA